jgi:uncharacterized membrane protein
VRLLQRFARGELHLTRIEAFSDGVFAIVVTLLVLELKVPALADHRSVALLAAALTEQLPKFLSWLLSFIIVCKFWLNHHQLLSQARSANYALVWLNSLFLLGQAFIPFPTALLGEYPANPLAVSLFGLVMALNTILFISLQAYLTTHLLRAQAQAPSPRQIRQGFVGPLSYLTGAAAAWMYPPLGFLLYLVTPLFYIVPPMPEPRIE